MIGKIILFGVICFLCYAIIPTYYNKWLNPSVLKNLGEGNEILLTFDDGPDPRYTPQLLDLLKEEHVPAAFFVVGENARANPELLRRMKEEGHTVSLHSYSHSNTWLLSFRKLKKELEEGLAAAPASCYRPPWGRSNLFLNHLLKKHGLQMVLWDVMAQDWQKSATPELICEKLLKRVKPGSIICLHDAGENSGGAKDAPLRTTEALRKAIPALRAKGCRFVSLDTIFVKEEAETWPQIKSHC